ncbi:hypothetical protein GQ53DRAFT_742187 [Thozetella sp. PMI_491]|nr:hypothetical protein GQ53DRAFT_742187 [Thozetella sp. PMI_491]
MDGLSSIATIAGVASAGLKLSTALFELVSNLRDAPRAMTEIARGISDTAIVLHQLRRILRDREELFKRRLLRSVGSAVQRIRAVHNEIRSMIRRCDGAMARVLWLFRQSRVSQLLAKIEAHKSAIGLMLHTMLLAVQLRQLPSRTGEPVYEDKRSSPEERQYLRRETENLIRTAHQSLVDLAYDDNQHPLAPADYEDDISINRNASRSTDNDPDEEIDNQQPDRTSEWLYDAVFSPLEGVARVTEIEDDEITSLLSSARNLSIAGSAVPTPAGSEIYPEKPFSDAGSATALVKITEISLDETDQQPSPHSPVVNQLLLEWTNLVEAEIEDGVVKRAPTRGHAEYITLTDKIGRAYKLPFHRCNTWEGLNEFLKDIFQVSDSAGYTTVKQGHYDIVGPDGEILSSSLWEDVVEPGCKIRIMMWGQYLRDALKY